MSKDWVLVEITTSDGEVQQFNMTANPVLEPKAGLRIVKIELISAVYTDKVIALRCDACGEMNEGIGYNPEYKTSFWCGSCGQPNDIKVKFSSFIQTKADTSVSDLPKLYPDIKLSLSNPPKLTQRQSYDHT